MLDLRRLRLLRELRERGTLAAVADALAYTPSAVSQQLAQLEREAGVPLLERVGRGVRLTDAALGLVEHTEAVLARLEQAEAELAAGTEERAGRRAHRRLPDRRARRSCCRSCARCPTRTRACAASSSSWRPRRRCRSLRVGDLDIVVAEEYSDVAAPARPGARARRDRAGPDRARAARRPSRRRARARAPARTRRRARGSRPRDGDAVRRRAAAHLPRGGRLRAGHPPPCQRRAHAPAARRRRARRRAGPDARPARRRAARRRPPGGRRGHRAPDLRRHPPRRRGRPSVGAVLDALRAQALGWAWDRLDRLGAPSYVRRIGRQDARKGYSKARCGR